MYISACDNDKLTWISCTCRDLPSTIDTETHQLETRKLLQGANQQLGGWTGDRNSWTSKHTDGWWVGEGLMEFIDEKESGNSAGE